MKPLDLNGLKRYREGLCDLMREAESRMNEYDTDERQTTIADMAMGMVYAKLSILTTVLSVKDLTDDEICMINAILVGVTKDSAELIAVNAHDLQG